MGTSKRRKTTPVAPARPTELTLLGTYQSPWGSVVHEIQGIEAGNWHPGTEDFRAVANTPNRALDKDGKVVAVKRVEVTEVGTVRQFAGAIQKYVDVGGKERPDHSIARLNLISHGNPGTLGLAGEMFIDGRCILGNANDTDPRLHTVISEHTMSWLNGQEEGTDPDHPSLGIAYRDMIRKKLAPGAQIWLFLCRAGEGGRGYVLAREMAQTFEIEVHAYEDEIWYWPDYGPHAITCPIPDPKELLGAEQKERRRFLAAGCIIGRNMTSLGISGIRGRGYFCYERVPGEFAGRHLENGATALAAPAHK